MHCIPPLRKIFDWKIDEPEPSYYIKNIKILVILTKIDRIDWTKKLWLVYFQLEF